MTSLIARILALVLTAAALGGCGFKPLYATEGHGAAVSSPEAIDALAATIIQPIADRDGVKLRTALRERMQPNGLSATPRFSLVVQMRSQISELGIRSDATASHANLIYTARFFLTEGNQRVLSETVQSIVSYNILDDQYATVAAVDNARERAIKQIGEEIKLRLAVYYEHRTHVVAAK